MKITKKTSRVLGVAFLLQFVTSFFSGTVLNPIWSVTRDSLATMARIATHVWVMQVNILVDMLTAFGIIFLGAVLFITLRKQNEPVAMVAFGFYILEATLLAVSKMPAFALLRISQEYAADGQPAALQVAGSLALESLNFMGGTLHMLAFCLGALLFYPLLYRSRVIPRGLSLWGLIAVIPCFVATVSALFGFELPFFVYLPYVPFELVTAVWILFKGAPNTTAVEPQILQPAGIS